MFRGKSVSSKVIGNVDEYNCQLNAEIERFARRELREEPSLRSQAIRGFRDWIWKQPDILRCRFDSSFLLRFLRVKKFSLPLAEELLMKYLTVRKVIPEWFRNLDCLDPFVKRIFDDGTVFALQGNDAFGRRVMCLNFAKLNAFNTNMDTFVRAVVIASETLLEKDVNQITGFTYLINFGNIGFRSSPLTPIIIQKMMTVLLKSYPARQKVIHCTNLPSDIKQVIDLFKLFGGAKMKERIKVYDNNVKFEDLVPKDILPKEFGGNYKSVKEVIDMWRAELMECRSLLMQMEALAIDENSSQKRANDFFQLNRFGNEETYPVLEFD